MQRDGQELSFDFNRTIERQIITLILKHAIVNSLKQRQAEFLEGFVRRTSLDAADGQAENSLAGALAVSERLGPAGSALADSAKEAWMNGLSEAMLIAAAIVGIAAVISAIWLPHEHHEGEDDAELDKPVIEG